MGCVYLFKRSFCEAKIWVGEYRKARTFYAVLYEGRPSFRTIDKLAFLYTA